MSAKHGFEPVVLKEGLSEQDAFALEAKTIAFYRAVGVRLANLTDGGEGPAGRVFSEASRAKMAAAKIGRKLSPGHAAKIGAAHRGMKRTEAQKANMRGRPFTAEHRANLSKAATGRKLSAETIKKIADSRRSAQA